MNDLKALVDYFLPTCYFFRYTRQAVELENSHYQEYSLYLIQLPYFLDSLWHEVTCIDNITAPCHEVSWRNNVRWEIVVIYIASKQFNISPFVLWFLDLNILDAFFWTFWMIFMTSSSYQINLISETIC